MSWTFPKPEIGYDDLEHALAKADAAGSLVLRLVVGERALDHRLVDRMLDVPELGQLYAGDLDRHPVELVIDLADCTFLDPYASTVIHSLVTHVAPQTGRIWVCLPVRDRVRAYCGVIGLTDALREYVRLVGEDHRQPPSQNSPVLVPLRVFAAAEDVPDLVAASVATLEQLLRRLAWPRQVISSAIAAIKEATMNVVEHAEATGSFALQAYKLDTDDPYVVVALSDAGVGIRSTLERKYTDLPNDDGKLLERLFDRRLTSREDHRHGFGMRTLRDAVRGVDGSLDVRSGAGLYHASNRGAWIFRRAPIPGTHLRLALNGPNNG